MFVESIEVSDLRCFAQATLRFRHPDEATASAPRLPNVTLLLGNNGAGKSTLLRAIALSALRPVIQSSGYNPFSMVRNRASGRAKTMPMHANIRGRLVLHPQDGDGKRAPAARAVPTTVQISRRGSGEVVDSKRQQKGAFWERMFDDDSPAFLLLGYGATRRVEPDESIDLAARQKSRQLRYMRVAGLFEEQMTLTPLNAWLPELSVTNKGRYTQVVNLLNLLLPDDTRFRGTRVNGHYVFEHRGIPVPFGAMSDGYRQYIGWIADLLYHVCKGCPSGKRLDQNRGIVLIDEIDLHLHPEWQRTVISTLSQTLPHLQFIMTSHSPILVGTLQKQNVVVLGVDAAGGSVAAPLSTEVHGMNADQVLTSQAFGLKTTRSPDFVAELKSTLKKADRGDRKAQDLYRKLMIYGSAGAAKVSKAPPTAPPEVLAASRYLKALASDGSAKSTVSPKRASRRKTA